MSDRTPGAYVLTVQLGGARITRGAARDALVELGFLDAAPAPSPTGTLAFHCRVTAGSEPEAIAYVASRAMTALVAAGVDAPVVESVEITVLRESLV